MLELNLTTLLDKMGVDWNGKKKHFAAFQLTQANHDDECHWQTL